MRLKPLPQLVHLQQAAPEGETSASAGEGHADANAIEPTPLVEIPLEAQSSEPRKDVPTQAEKLIAATADASTIPNEEENERDEPLDEVDPSSVLVP